MPQCLGNGKKTVFSAFEENILIDNFSAVVRKKLCWPTLAFFCSSETLDFG